MRGFMNRKMPTIRQRWFFGHGICVEFDHYHQMLDEITQLTEMGIRVVRPEAPWHGRRVLPGHYGGEQLLSALPTSMIEFIAAQHREWAVLINWCREKSDGSVAIGGSSLGAQSAKAIAGRACGWPKRLRPNALFVIAHSQYIWEGAQKGALSDVWNVGGTMIAKGWHKDSERAWLQRLDVPGPPCMAPDQIISVTGTYDTVTADATAHRQLDAWGVPPDNRFSYGRGHFSLPLGLVHDPAPLVKLAAILKDADSGG